MVEVKEVENEGNRNREGKKGKIHIKDQLLKWILTFLGHIESKKVIE